MKYKFLPQVDPTRYENFVKNHEHCHLFQSYAWAKMKPNWQVQYFAMEDEEGSYVATALVLKRPLLFGKSLWYVPKGPILDYGREDLLKAFLSNLGNYAKKHKAAFLKINPPMHLYRGKSQDYHFEESPWIQALKKTIESLNFQHQGYFLEMHSTIQPRFSSVVYTLAYEMKYGNEKSKLQVIPRSKEKSFHEQESEQTVQTIFYPSSEENVQLFLASLPKRTHRFLKDAEKRCVRVERQGIEGLDALLATIHKTEARKGIQLRNRKYFERFFSVYPHDCLLYVASIDLDQAISSYQKQVCELKRQVESLEEKAYKRRAIFNDQIHSLEKYLKFFEERRQIDPAQVPLAACLSVIYGHSCEMLYAGMNDDYAKITAQFPVYVETMCEAFQQACTHASMGGVEGNLQDGLLTFKESFSPLLLEEIGEFDQVYSHFLYFAFKHGLPFLRKVRSFLRRKN